ncbi:expressed unknown protein [Seminavis robusta]|uniref:MYND-type domain-containing protein n=1 Tax=Seminavis robusta TaxID=568900 RepID=A0A9N8D4M8_9STRA|nr:expressed unknown protein [Seminavis robusta]|eukprot:Sro4_g002980.1 n/a (544) ;mRNA; r:22057-23762
MADEITDNGDSLLMRIKLDPMAVPKILGGTDGVWAKLNVIGDEASPPFMGEHYGKLHRAPTVQLPMFNFSDVEFVENGVEQTFRKMYEGDVTMKTTIKFSSGDNRQVESIVLIASLDSEDVDQRFLGSFARFYVGGDRYGTDSSNSFQIQGAISSPFVSFLPSAQRDALYSRMLHLFLRSHGAFLDFTLLDNWIGDLKAGFVNDGRWKEALDVAMILADVSLTHSECTQKGFALEQAAQLLRTTKSYANASLVVQDFINFFWDDSLMPLSVAYQNVACAAKAARNFQEAEDFHVKALNVGFAAHGNKFPWSEGAGTGKPRLLNGVLQLYTDWLELDTGSFDLSAVVALVALLAVAEATGIKKKDRYFEDLFAEISAAAWGCSAQKARDSLMPQYRSKSAAQRALTEAVSEPCSGQKFRSSVTKCLVLPKIPFFVDNDYMNSLKVLQRKQDFKKRMKEASRSFVARKVSTATTPESSMKPCFSDECGAMCSKNDLKFCPCMTVGYCGKDCQIQDWKRHKNGCPWQAQKKASKKSKKKAHTSEAT